MSFEASPRVFWSWQSDFSPATCRTFVRSALVEAIEQINNDMDVNDADRPEVDHDTKGERGMVDIASTILTKIANSAVFVADLTPIAQSSSGKWLPNPNVMIELGSATPPAQLGRETALALNFNLDHSVGLITAAMDARSGACSPVLSGREPDPA